MDIYSGRSQGEADGEAVRVQAVHSLIELYRTGFLLPYGLVYWVSVTVEFAHDHLVELSRGDALE